MSALAVRHQDTDKTYNRLKSLTLRCCAYQSSEMWIAECIDLDLIASGKTPEQAIGGLHNAITGYVRTVLDGNSLDGLIPRPSPFSHRLRYHGMCLRAAFAHNRHNFRLLDCSPSQFATCA